MTDKSKFELGTMFTFPSTVATWEVVFIGNTGVVGRTGSREVFFTWSNLSHDVKIIESFFEVGKKYRFIRGGYGTYEVIAVAEHNGRKYALSISEVGGPISWAPHEFKEMEEVTD